MRPHTIRRAGLSTRVCPNCSSPAFIDRCPATRSGSAQSLISFALLRGNRRAPTEPMPCHDEPYPSDSRSLRPEARGRLVALRHLCAAFHASQRKKRLCANICAYRASERGLAFADAAGNLILRKPASARRCRAPSCKRTSTWSAKRTPIRCTTLRAIRLCPCCATSWLRAENTTLGADNGIGVALALAALEDESLVHGPLEVLLTVDEEAGMGGARGLEPAVAGAAGCSIWIPRSGASSISVVPGDLMFDVKRCGIAEAMPAHYFNLAHHAERSARRAI